MDIIKFEILEDGQIVMETDDVSEKNHAAADDILELIEESLGSKSIPQKKEHPLLRNKNVLRGGRIVPA